MLETDLSSYNTNNQLTGTNARGITATGVFVITRVNARGMSEFNAKWLLRRVPQDLDGIRAKASTLVQWFLDRGPETTSQGETFYEDCRV